MLVVLDVEFQVHLPERELPHHHHRGLEVTRLDHPVEELVGNLLARLMVPGKQIQALTLPGPVLHDLRRELDEVPRHLRTAEQLHLDISQDVMEQVTELVKDRLDLAVGEQRRFVAYRGGHVPADQAHVGLKGTVRPVAGGNDVHPRTTALRLARVQVGIERSKMFPARVVANLEELDVGVPDFRLVLDSLGHCHAEYRVDELEHPRNHLVDRKIGAQFLFIQVVASFLQFLAPVRAITRFEVTHRRTDLLRGELIELRNVVAPGIQDTVVQILDKRERCRTVLRHPAFQHHIGELRLAQQLRLFTPERENLPDEIGVVVFRIGSNPFVLIRHLPANIAIVQKLQHRKD